MGNVTRKERYSVCLLCVCVSMFCFFFTFMYSGSSFSENNALFSRNTLITFTPLHIYAWKLSSTITVWAAGHGAAPRWQLGAGPCSRASQWWWGRSCFFTRPLDSSCRCPLPISYCSCWVPCSWLGTDVFCLNNVLFVFCAPLEKWNGN